MTKPAFTPITHTQLVADIQAINTKSRNLKSDIRAALSQDNHGIDWFKSQVAAFAKDKNEAQSLRDHAITYIESDGEELADSVTVALVGMDNEATTLLANTSNKQLPTAKIWDTFRRYVLEIGTDNGVKYQSDLRKPENTSYTVITQPVVVTANSQKADNPTPSKPATKQVEQGAISGDVPAGTEADTSESQTTAKQDDSLKHMLTSANNEIAQLKKALKAEQVKVGTLENQLVLLKSAMGVKEFNKAVKAA